MRTPLPRFVASPARSASPARYRRPVRSPLTLEALEVRETPATFSGAAGAVLTINLTNLNEAVSLSTTGTTITVISTNNAVDGGGNGGNISAFGTTTTSISGGFTTINIIDGAAGTSVAFPASTGSFSQNFGITLDDAASGNITFTGPTTLTLPANLTATTTNGFISSTGAGSLTVGGNLSLSAGTTSRDVLLVGSVGVTGTTTLSGLAVQADNAANNFVGALSVTSGRVATIVDSNDLVLGASTFGQISSPQPTTRITAGGNVTQTGAVVSTANILDVRSTGGSITLTNVANNIDTLSLGVTDAGTASATSLTGLKLDNITAGTGLVTLSTGSGNLTQNIGATIRTGGPLTVNATTGTVNVLLTEANRIAGAVSVLEAGGDVQNVNLHNVADTASFPTVPALASAGDINLLTLTFDNAGIVLPAPAPAPANLTLSAGGDITQLAAFSITGNFNASVRGDFGITLNNAANLLTGPVFLDAADSTQPVVITNNTTLTIGDSALGRGNFTATSTGNISASGAALIQRKGAGTATFNAAGTTVDLGNAANDFTGNVVIGGATVTTVLFANNDPQARFGQLQSLPAGMAALTYNSPAAAVLLPALSLTTLNVTAPGVFQQTGSALVVSGTTTVNALNNRIVLGGANNFNILAAGNTGRNDVVINDINALQFGGSSFGTGRLTVTAAGNISQQGATIINQAGTGPFGAVTLSSAGGSIVLGNNNGLRGRVNATVVGAAGTLTLNNVGAPLTLGNITTGAATFTATSNINISQYPGSKLTLGGGSAFNSTTDLTLANKGNSFAGAVALTALNATLTASGPVTLAASTVNGGLVVTTGGKAADSLTQTGAITAIATSTFNTGAGNITLANPGNNFNQVRLNSTGSSVAVTDANALTVGPSQLGAGTLAVTTNGNIFTAGPVVQSGPGAITLTTGAGNGITLNSDNVLPGAVTVVGSGDVNIRNSGDLTFAPASIVTGNLIATSGGNLTLPSDLTQINSLTLSARKTTLGSDVIITGGNLDIGGTVEFTGNRAVTITGGTSATFRNDMIVGGTLTFTMPANRNVNHVGGIWMQGANNLTINGAGASLVLGGSGRERFVMTGGAINLTGNGNLLLNADATFQAGNAATPETVTINNGTGNVTFAANSILQVGLGTTNDQLIVNGFGLLDVQNALLRTTGLAAATATPVLISQTAVITGRFAGTVDAANSPADVFTGSDIVTPAYSVTQVSVKVGGTASATGTATGFLPDGDAYTVKSTLGATAGLATLVDSAGRLNAVVRSTSGTPQTLTISTTGGGDGVIPVAGLMIQGVGPATISAGAVDFTGLLTTNGTLAGLTARDLGVGTSLDLNAGGPATSANSLTGRLFGNVRAGFAGALSSLAVVAADNSNATITADKFGALKTTGSPALGSAGDFFAKLTSTTAGVGQVLGAATIAGTLGGTWDLGGTVGSVKTGKVNGWTLGVEPSSQARNGGLLTNVTKLDLGDVFGSFSINSVGTISTLQAAEMVGSSFIHAAALGTMSVTGSGAAGLAGNLSSTVITLAGNAGGALKQALGSLTVAGDISSFNLTAANGNVGTVKTSRGLLSSSINATDTGAIGNVGSVTASRISSVVLNARSLSAVNVVPNLPAGLLGDVSSLTLNVTGNVAGVGLGTFAASGGISGGSFTSSGGSVTKITSGRTVSGSSLTVSDPNFGKLGTFQAASFSNVTVTARTIDLINASGAKAAGPASQLIIGDFAGGGILAYDETGVTASLKTLSAAGSLNSASVQAERGVGTLTVGRTINNTNLVADDALAVNAAVGRVGALTAGAVNGSTLFANTIGTAKVTGFPTPELSPGSRVVGDITATTLQANGATPTLPVGIGSLTVERTVVNSFVTAPGGITTLTTGGTINNTSLNLENVVNPAAGFLTTLTTAGIESNSQVRVGAGGVWKVNSSPKFLLPGQINNSALTFLANAVTGTGTKVLASLTVAGDFLDGTIDAAASVGAVTINGQVRSTSGIAQVQAGYAAGARLEKLAVGTWGGETDTNPVRLASRSVGTIAVTGNAGRGLGGFVRNGYFDIIGNNANIGLGSLTATGNVTSSVFRVSDGDVTSFKAQRFETSDLLVGFRPVSNNNLIAAPVAANWATTNRKIGLFQTTAPFNATDTENSASFRDSNVVAALLGSITLSGVDPTDPDTTTYGIGFRASAAVPGTLKINGSASAFSPNTSNGQFNFAGLAG